MIITYFLSHLRSHKQLKDCVSRFGFFWGPIIHGASIGRILKATDIFKDREGFGCPFCDAYFTSSSCGFTQHLNKMHKGNHRIEGETVPKPVRVKLKTLIHNEVVDDELEELERLKAHHHDSDDSLFANSPHTPNDNLVVNDDNVDVLANNISSSNCSSSIASEAVINISNDSVSSLQDVSVKEVDTEEEEDVIEIERSDLIRKATKWLKKCEDEELNGVSLPRLMRKQRMRVIEPIRRLFKTKIKSLIRYIRILNNNEEDWLITQGILARISLLIRKTIRTALHIPLNSTKKKKVRNRDIMYNRSTISIKKYLNLRNCVISSRS